MFSFFKKIDWILFASALLISAAGLITMKSFAGSDVYFYKQIAWIIISFSIGIAASFFDVRALRKTYVVSALFAGILLILLLLFAAGHISKGAQSWFRLGSVAFQPTDMAKLVLIIVLAKYFSRRHVEIRDIKHIIVSGAYAFLLFILVLLQPDFGSAIILFFIWFGMVLLSGISKKHLLFVLMTGFITFGALWQFGFKEYQKARIRTFIHPLTDISGKGYNAYQSMITVGSGQLLGKGIGMGTQSRLKFLPEYQTDFIFAAFAEEWGFVGAILLFILYAIVFGSIVSICIRGETNFEILFGAGVIIFLLSHFVINIGMNIGVMPVTGITLPFMSYGGSHLLAEFICLGLIQGTKRYARSVHREVLHNEFLGLESKD